MTWTPPSNAIRPAHAERVWALLEQYVGAKDPNDWKKKSFLRYVCVNEPFGHEFRFEGNLGFGGKFLNDGWRWVVTCYREDETAERLAAIDKVNEALLKLRLELGLTTGV